MKRQNRRKGALTVEASISYSIFLMVIVTILYLMRIVYTYGLVQHAVSQTAKELSLYTYFYQISGVSEWNQGISGAVSDRTDQFNKDAEDLVQFYKTFGSEEEGEYNGTTNILEFLKNLGAAMIKEGHADLTQNSFELAAELTVRPLLASYIGADAPKQSDAADARLKALRVVDGLSGLNLENSHFFEDGETIDLIVCYTIDPVMPIDILPELHLVNRAYIRGMNGDTVFSKASEDED